MKGAASEKQTCDRQRQTDRLRVRVCAVVCLCVCRRVSGRVTTCSLSRCRLFSKNTFGKEIVDPLDRKPRAKTMLPGFGGSIAITWYRCPLGVLTVQFSPKHCLSLLSLLLWWLSLCMPFSSLPFSLLPFVSLTPVFLEFLSILVLWKWDPLQWSSRLADPIIGIDVSADGEWILATCKTYLLVVPTKLPNDTTGFEVCATCPVLQLLQLLSLFCLVHALPACLLWAYRKPWGKTNPYQGVFSWNLRILNAWVGK